MSRSNNNRRTYLIYPRYIADKLNPEKEGFGKTAMIQTSTYSFDTEHLNNNQFQGLLRINFDDITENEQKANILKGVETVLFNEDMARQIIEFTIQNKNVDTFITACDGGVSRSSAMMIALTGSVFDCPKLAFDIMCSPKYDPNSTVLQVLRRTYDLLYEGPENNYVHLYRDMI